MFSVKGYDSLRKNTTTGAVINIDKDGLRAAKMARQKIIDSKQREIELDQRIKILETIVGKLLEEKEQNGIV